MDSGILLTYHSATIRTQDLFSLQPYGWLTDEVITFFLQYLEHADSFPQDSLLICPSVSATLCLSDIEEHQDLSKQFAPLNLANKRLFLCPINNGDGLSVGSGEHWALLLGIRSSQLIKFYYLDSLGGTSCLHQASKLSSALSALTLNNASLWDVELSSAVVKGVPKQLNAYDCGIYSLLMVRRILEKKEMIMEGEEDTIREVIGKITSNQPGELRKEITQIIESLMNK